jgi:hypothetical protein
MTLALVPSATSLHGSDYRIVCLDKEKRAAWESAVESGIPEMPPVQLIPPSEYKGGCEEEGASSTFFLFNMIPVTPPIDPEYAISSAVQRIEGDSMIHIHLYEEIHYYSILGRAVLLKARGDVIRFPDREGNE